MEPIWALDDGDAYKDPSKNQNQRDIILQAVISIALGIAAFLAFCVSYGQASRGGNVLTRLVVRTSQVDWTLCRQKETEKCCLNPTRAPGYIFRMDTNTISYHGRRGPGLGGSRRIRCECYPKVQSCNWANTVCSFSLSSEWRLST